MIYNDHLRDEKMSIQTLMEELELVILEIFKLEFRERISRYAI